MFIGHYAAGLAAKKWSQSLSLALSFVAVQFLDLLWPLLVLMGVETFEIKEGITALTPLDFTYYPYSHSLLMAVIWGLLFGLVYFLIAKNARNAVIYGILVISHWFLDLIVHRPDLPLSPFSGIKLGLGMWNYPALEMIFEFGFFVLGILLYYKYAQPQRKIAFWSLMVFLLIIQLLNQLGPPPPSIEAVAWSANLMWIFVIWAWLIERGTGKERDV